MIYILAIVYVSIAGVGFWLLARTSNKLWNDDIKNHLESSINNIKTIQDCNDVINEICERGNKVDPLYKGIRAEYWKYFERVKGIREGLIKMEEQHGNNT